MLTELALIQDFLITLLHTMLLTPLLTFKDFIRVDKFAQTIQPRHIFIDACLKTA
jgi:hypothetical protein